MPFDNRLLPRLVKDIVRRPSYELRWHFALLWAHLTYQIGEKTQLKTDVVSQDHLKMDCEFVFSQF